MMEQSLTSIKYTKYIGAFHAYLPDSINVRSMKGLTTTKRLCAFFADFEYVNIKNSCVHLLFTIEYA